MGNATDVLQVLELGACAKNAQIEKETEENYYPPITERVKNYRNNPKKGAFGWVGGKSLMGNAIIKEFPEHYKTYVEVFAGALNILFKKERSKVEIVNDIFEELINLYITIRHKPQTLRYYINKMLVSRDLFMLIRNNNLIPRNDIERAAFYYYRLQISYGSAGRNFVMPKRHHANKNIHRSFKVWSDRLKGVCIENLDFQKLIENYDTEGTLFYLDPPYYKTEYYYEGSKKGGFVKSDHERLANTLKAIKGKFILSYNKCKAIRDLYKGYTIKELPTSYGLHAGERINTTELIIKNF